MDTHKKPCHGHAVFTNPKMFDEATADAMNMCDLCPHKKACALEALTAGDTLDKLHKAPAAGVIQAGVWCDGDQATANALAAIADVSPPHIGAHKRFRPPAECKGCGKPMETRIKGVPLGADILTHAAHGYCRICDARRRRQKGWESAQPKNSTVFTWKEKRHGSNGPGRNPDRRGPRNRPDCPGGKKGRPLRPHQEALF